MISIYFLTTTGKPKRVSLKRARKAHTHPKVYSSNKKSRNPQPCKEQTPGLWLTSSKLTGTDTSTTEGIESIPCDSLDFHSPLLSLEQEDSSQFFPLSPLREDSSDASVTSVFKKETQTQELQALGQNKLITATLSKLSEVYAAEGPSTSCLL